MHTVLFPLLWILNPDQGCTSLTMAMLSSWKPGEPGLMSRRRVRLVSFILIFSQITCFQSLFPLPNNIDRLRGQRCSGTRATCKTSWGISSPLVSDPSGDQCIHTWGDSFRWKSMSLDMGLFWWNKSNKCNNGCIELHLKSLNIN